MTNKKVIEDIMISRDKSYAHTDKDREKYEKTISISIRQVEDILKLVEEIVREIYLTVFESGLHLGTVGFDSRKFDMVKILVAHRAEAIAPMVKLLKEIIGTES
jgi:AbiU2